MTKLNHRKKKQQGVVILILCHFFLVAALAFSMAIYSGIASQSQSIRNEITYRKNFWIAASGLECAMAVFSNQPERGAEGLDCALSPKLVVQIHAQNDQQYKVESSVDNVSLTQTLQVQALPERSVSWLKGSWRDYE